MNLSSSLFKNPVYAILLLTNTIDEGETIDFPGLSQIISRNKLPKFDKQDLLKIEQSSFNGQGITQLLMKQGYDFPFFPQTLSPLIEISNENQQTKFLICWVLNTALSYTVYFYNTRDLTFANQILKLLIIFTNNELYNYALSCFIHVFKSISIAFNSSNVSDFITTLIHFYSLQFDHVVEYTHLLSIVLKATIDDTYNMTELTKKTIIRANEYLRNGLLQLDQYSLDTILNILLPFLLKLEENSLSFFQLAINSGIPSDFETIIRMLPLHFLELNKHASQKVLWKTIENPVAFESNIILESSIELLPPKKSETELQISPVDFGKELTISSMLPSDILLKLERITDILYKREKFTHVFFEELLKLTYEDPNCYGNILTSATIFLGYVSSYANLGLLIAQSPIFDPKITIFDKCEGFEYINTLRKYALDMILSEQWYDALEELITKSYKYPNLISEILYRLTITPIYISRFIVNFPKIIKTIRMIFSYYKSLWNSSQENIEYIIRAEASTFYFISILFQNIKIARCFINVEIFMTSFTSLLMDDNTRKFALSEFEQLFNTITPEDCTVVINHFIPLIANLIVSLDIAHSISVISQIFILLLKAIRSRKEFAPIFTILLHHIFEIIKNLKPSNTDHVSLFKLLFSLIIEITSSTDLKKDFSDMLSDAITLLYNNTCPTSIYEMMIRLMNGNIENYEPKFVIKCTNSLIIYMKVCSKCKLFDQAQKFLIDLINFSPENAKIANREGVDLYLLSQLSESDESNVPKILQLFKEISCIYSSPMVVKSYITLLSPVENQISNIHPLLMKTLSDISSNPYWLQKRSSLLGSNVLNQSDFDIGDNFSQGFSFSFWTIIREPDTTIIPIFNLEIEDVIMSIYIKEFGIYIYWSSEHDSKELLIPYKFRKGIWYMLIANAKTEQNSTIISVVINNNELILETFNSISIHKQYQGHAKIGTTIHNLKGIAELGVSFLTNLLTPEQISELSSSTPSSNVPLGIKSFCSFEPNNSGSPIDESSFVYTIVKLWKFDITLPLFSLFNVPFADGNLWTDAPSETISIFAKMLMSCDFAERYFFEQKKFSLIARILLQYPPKMLDHKIYTEFFNLFELINNVNLKKHLLDSILLDPYIWITADAEDHLKILNHWSTTLFSKFIKYVNEIRPIHELLNILEFFYWFNETGNIVLCGKNSKRPRDENLNIAVCRDEINKCIVYSASLKFDAEILLNIFKQCNSLSNDPEQVKSLLELSYELVSSAGRLNPIKLDKQIFASMHDLISKNEDIPSLYLMKIIAAIAKNKMLSSSDLCDFLEVCIFSMNTKTLKNEFYEGVCELLLGQPIFLPIACWLADTKDDEGKDLLVKYIEKLKPSKDYMDHKNWFVWPLIFASKLDSVSLKKVILFLYKCGKDLNTFLNQLAVVCASMQRFGEDYHSEVLLSICELINDNKISSSSENIAIIFKHAFFFMMMRHESSPNRALINEYLNSPFAPPNQPTENTKNVDDYKNLQGFSLLNNFIRNSIDINNFICSYRISGYPLRWLDSLLAEQLLKLMVHFDTIQVNSYGAFLATLIMKSNTNIENCYTDIFSRINKYTSHIVDITDSFSKLFDIGLKAFNEIKLVNQEMTEGFKNILSIATDFINTISEDIESEDKHVTQAFSRRILAQHESNEQWKRIMSAMTSENAPKKITRWKRDNTSTYYGCPIKLKINHNFNDHMLASKFRDSVVAEVSPESYKAKKADFPPKRILSNGRYTFVARCKLIKVTGCKRCWFGYSQNTIDIISGDSSITTIPHPHIRFVYYRTRYHKPNSIEIFTHYGKTYFIEFVDTQNSLTILKKMDAQLKGRIQTTNFIDFMSNSGFTDKWVNGKMSNFGYLMTLNLLSGRSFNDMSQYPIFPLIIVLTDNYNINDPAMYRDLTKPIGALSDEKLEKLIEKMSDNDDHYLYSSGPISSLIICHYLIRMEPFTSCHIELQSGKFDVADRIFANYNLSIKNVFEDINDTRELVPEFFFEPEFLKNTNDFDLGATHSGKIGDVVLPPWASSPLDFVYKQRKALESDHVSKLLNEWIDLIWGDKQRGEEAEKANNLYEPKLLEDIWDVATEKFGEDSPLLMTLKTYLKFLGQIPHRLFTKPHPKKNMNIKSVLTGTYTCNLQSMKSVIYANFDKLGRLVLVSEDGIIHFLNELTSNQTFQVVEVDAQPISSKSIRQSVNKDCLFCMGHDFIIATAKSASNFFVLGLDKQVASTTPSPHKEICSISADGPYLATSGTDNILNIYRSGFSKKIAYSTHIYRETVTCMAVSETFKVIVSGTRDGGIIVTNLANGNTIMVLDVKGEPVKVAVTPSWGFIVALVCSESNFTVSVFTINGDFVIEKAVRCDSLVTNMVSFASAHGFDYICVSNSKGRLLVAEVYTLQFNVYSTGISTGFVNIMYSLNTESIVLVEKSGKITYQPINISIT